MDFNLTLEQRMLIESAARIGAEFGLDYWRELDGAHRFPSAIWSALCETGLVGAAIPVEMGGSGLGMLDLTLIIEAVTAGGGGVTLAQLFMLNPVFGCHAIARFGNERMKRDYLPRLLSGKSFLSFALTEPDAGNNSLNITTMAVRNDQGWQLRGQKVWITIAGQSDLMLVVARTRAAAAVQKRTDGISMFLIDTARAGIRMTEIEKAATRTLPSYSVFFDDVQVSEDDLVGTLDGAWPQLVELLNSERIVTAAGLVGTGQLAIRLATEYAKQRKVFGTRSIAEYQAVQFPLARCHAELECARLMNRKAAWLLDNGQPFGSEANAAKLIAADAAVAATDRALQTLGGMGFAREFHVERLWRDARVFAVAPIPQEMILSFIGTHDLGMPRSY
jgi:acyl-CoA dehydrogenase